MQIEITPEYLASQGLSPTFEKRFWDKVFILPYDRGCWLWTAVRSGGHGYDSDYGRIATRGHSGYMIPAHIGSWIIHRGPIPEGMCVLHRCDNPPCVNPDHLFIGTYKDNAEDRDAKGRFKPLRGESNGAAKVTAEQVLCIRQLWRDRVSQVEIGRRFGVTDCAIWRIVHRRNWRHIKDKPCPDIAYAPLPPRTGEASESS